MCSWKVFWHHFFLWRVPDYIMIIAVAVIAAIVGAVVRPHCRTFEWSDPTIGYLFATQEVFPMYAVAIAVVFVSLVYVAGELLTRWHRPAGHINMFLHLNGWILAQAYSIIVAFAIVNTSKLYAGRLRPDFINRLTRAGITEADVNSMTPEEVCGLAREGRLSFPSGHSGTAISGFFTPCLYLLGLLRTLNGGFLWLSTLAMVPMIFPIVVAISRTRDNRHNFSDILAGAVIGVFCSVAVVAISFRPNRRAEWTLRDHPDDGAPAKAVLSGPTVYTPFCVEFESPEEGSPAFYSSPAPENCSAVNALNTRQESGRSHGEEQVDIELAAAATLPGRPLKAIPLHSGAASEKKDAHMRGASNPGEAHNRFVSQGTDAVLLFDEPLAVKRRREGESVCVRVEEGGSCVTAH